MNMFIYYFKNLNLNLMEEEIINRKIEEISPLFFFNFLETNEDFDIIFYKYFYGDLSNLTDNQAIHHYIKYGIYENRIPNIKIFGKLHPNFVFEEYFKMYSSIFKNKSYYDILYDYHKNFFNRYPNLKKLEDAFNKSKINFKLEYIKNSEKFKDVNYYEIKIKMIEMKEKEILTDKANKFITKEFENIDLICKLLNYNNYPDIRLPHTFFMLDKKFKNLVYNKTTFYKNFKFFDFEFYNKLIKQELCEDDAISHFYKYGRFNSNIKESLIEKKKIEKLYLKTFYIILNNYDGGSFKYIMDIINNYPENNYVIIQDIEKIQFKKDDIILVQFCGLELMESIQNIKREYGCCVIVNLHDFFWLSDNLSFLLGDVYKKYLDTEFNKKSIDFLNSCDFCVSPSNFIFQKYFDCGLKNIKIAPHIDLEINDYTNKKQNLSNKINLGIIHDYSEYKGKKIYDILKRIYQNIEIDGFQVNFITLGEEIPAFSENEYFDLIQEYNIHALLLLNNYGETYCYTLTKALKTGLPILYNNIGAFRERIVESAKYKILFDNEDDIMSFINFNYSIDILNKFEEFIKISILHNNNPHTLIYKNDLNLEIKTNFFYDSLYGNFKTSDLIDIYAIYFPQFHVIEQNNKNFYKGYTDFENIKILKKKQPNYNCLTPKQENYNLLVDGLVEEQVKTAKQYGIKGFGCYYYWFSESQNQDNMIMRKAVDKLFSVEDDEFKLFFIWANEDWNDENYANPRNIYNKYDTTEFNKNIKNLITYFKNPKYLLEDNKPVLFIYHPWFFKDNNLYEFEKIINKKCKNEGFDGCKLVVNDINGCYPDIKNFSIQPNYKKFEHQEIDYRDFYSDMNFERNSIQTFFLNFDNTPRFIKPEILHKMRKFTNNTEEDLKEAFYKTIQHYSHKSKGIDRMLLINSWNEWGEQMVIEPSKEKGTYFLDLIKSWNESPLSL